MSDSKRAKAVLAFVAAWWLAILAIGFLGGCGGKLPVSLTSNQAPPLAASLKAFSHVPLSSEPNPRDVCDEDGEPNLGTRIMIKGDLGQVRDLLARLLR